MDVGVPIVFLATMAFVLLGAGMIVLVLVLMVRGRTKSPSVHPTAVPTPPPSREARARVLQQLSDRQITVDEAEVRLAALGNPVPITILTGAPASKSSLGSGCLMILGSFMAIWLIVLLVCVAMGLFFGFYQAVEADFGPGVRMETLHTEQVHLESEAEVVETTDAEVTDETIKEWEEDTQ